MRRYFDLLQCRRSHRLADMIQATALGHRGKRLGRLLGKLRSG
ncbi:MAG TPA: hypothetical protein VK971_03100 [Thiohalobacter sp.]|nr:hypothetical protein [Thiohalobacter sp.]